MNIAAEKEDIIRKFQLVHDIDLIKAIKSLLDFGLHKQNDDEEEDAALNASIQRGIDDANNGRVRPHEDVMADFRLRYNL